MSEAVKGGDVIRQGMWGNPEDARRGFEDARFAFISPEEVNSALTELVEGGIGH